jgi:hypothetical protein
MLSVTYKPFMPSVIMLNVIILSVVMLCVVAPPDINLKDRFLHLNYIMIAHV